MEINCSGLNREPEGDGHGNISLAAHYSFGDVGDVPRIYG